MPSTPRSVLITYATKLTGNKSQACKIVDHVLLEGITILVDTRDEKKAQAFVVAEIRRLCYEYMNKLNNMKKVYKYKLLQGINRLMMPEGAQVLTVQLQEDIPTIWALVDPDSPLKERAFLLAGTGHEIEVNTSAQPVYVGTVQIDWMVWHCFEVFE
jgi:hypothetical protein